MQGLGNSQSLPEVVEIFIFGGIFNYCYHFGHLLQHFHKYWSSLFYAFKYSLEPSQSTKLVFLPLCCWPDMLTYWPVCVCKSYDIASWPWIVGLLYSIEKADFRDNIFHSHFHCDDGGECCSLPTKVLLYGLIPVSRVCTWWYYIQERYGKATTSHINKRIKSSQQETVYSHIHLEWTRRRWLLMSVVWWLTNESMR